MTKPVEILADHLDRLLDPTSERDLLAAEAEAVFTIAEAIVADPQSHMDALEKAKAVHRGISWPSHYIVVPPDPPHVHEWEVTLYPAVTDGKVAVTCLCGEMRWVSPKLPIEVPE